ncbi:hypothetical protein [Vibrio vulnificus]|uniref:hypothetical protein n=1 Tax=Vibrio vulnificus TaxID=672 RepID=UPI001592F73D|nr:hypothetical protein [Vibrio vulnificus]NVC72620.1 hypothetical protein [Vibrio vulnificus]
MINIEGFDYVRDHMTHLQVVLENLDSAMNEGTSEAIREALTVLDASDECFWYLHPDVAKEIKDSISNWCRENGYTSDIDE